MGGKADGFHYPPLCCRAKELRWCLISLLLVTCLHSPFSSSPTAAASLLTVYLSAHVLFRQVLSPERVKD